MGLPYLQFFKLKEKACPQNIPLHTVNIYYKYKIIKNNCENKIYFKCYLDSPVIYENVAAADHEILHFSTVSSNSNTDSINVNESLHSQSRSMRIQKPVTNKMIFVN